jgi:transposase
MLSDARRLVFIDESGAKTNMTRSRGRGRRGQRVRDHAPHGHWHTTTMIGSIRFDGTVSCMAIDGSATREVFRAYVKHILGPTLRHGDVVVVDNLSVHKDAESREIIESFGANLAFLPPYSPDFNPIEKMWSKVKTNLRSAKARTHPGLISAIGEALSKITASDARGYFFSCGYATSQT